MYIHGDIILPVYVDDILIAGPSIQTCNATVALHSVRDETTFAL
jgi:hypothetical protein